MGAVGGIFGDEDIYATVRADHASAEVELSGKGPRDDDVALAVNGHGFKADLARRGPGPDPGPRKLSCRGTCRRRVGSRARLENPGNLSPARRRPVHAEETEDRGGGNSPPAP